MRDPWPNNRARDRQLRKLPLAREEREVTGGRFAMVLAIATVLYFIAQFCR